MDQGELILVQTKGGLYSSVPREWEVEAFLSRDIAIIDMIVADFGNRGHNEGLNNIKDVASYCTENGVSFDEAMSIATWEYK